MLWALLTLLIGTLLLLWQARALRHAAEENLANAVANREAAERNHQVALLNHRVAEANEAVAKARWSNGAH